jgi:MFS family permease
MNEIRENQEATLKRAIRLNIWFSAINAANWTLCLGAPLVMLIGEWGGSALQVGIVSSFLYIFTPIQLWSNVLMGRMGYKRLMVSGWSTRNFFLLPIPLILLFYGLEAAQWKIYVAMIGVGLFACTRSIAVTAQMPWLYALIPEGHRGRFFSNYMLGVNLTGATMFLLSALSFSMVNNLLAFNLIFWIALMCGFVAAWVLAKIPDVEKPEAVSLREVNQLTWNFLRTPGNYRRVLFMWAWAAACWAPLTPFLIYYVSQKKIMEPDYVMLMAFLSFVGGVAGAALSRSWLDYIGIRLFSVFGLLGMAFSMVCTLAIISYEHWNHAPFEGMVFMLLTMMFFFGAFQSVWYTSGLKLQPYFTKEKNRALQISLFQIVSPLSAGISSIIWGGLLRAADGDVEVVSVPALICYFIVSLVILLASSVYMIRMPIQEAIPRPFNFLAKLLRK